MTEEPSLFSAAQYSIEVINNREDILPNHTLSLVRGASDSVDEAIVSYVENIAYSNVETGCVVGIVGPVDKDSVQVISSLNNQQQQHCGDRGIAIPHIHLSSLLQDGGVYANSFGILGSQLHLIDAVISMVNNQNWDNILLLHEDDGSELVIERLTRQLTGRISTQTIRENHVFLEDTDEVMVVMVLARAPLVCEVLQKAMSQKIMYPAFQLVVMGLKYEQLALNSACQLDKLMVVLNQLILVTFNIDIGSGAGYHCYHYKCIQQQWKTGKLNCDNCPLVYDSIWALALAINGTLGVYKNNNNNNSSCWDDRFNSLVSSGLANINFKGISGSINFDEASGYNIRRVDILRVSINNTEPELIGYFYNGSLSFFNGSNISFGRQLESVRIEVAFFLTLLTLIQFFVIFTLHVLMLVYRKHTSIRASSSKLSNIVFIGCYLLIATLMLFLWPYKTIPVWEGRGAICLSFTVWLFPVSLSLVFGPLIAHIWRLYRIFAHFNRPGCCLSDNALYGIVTMMILVDLLIGLANTVLTRVSVSFESTGRVSMEGNLIFAPKCNLGPVWVLIWVHKYIQASILFVLSCLTSNVKMTQDFSTGRFKIGSYLIIVLSTTLLPLYLFLWISDADIHGDVVVFCILGNCFLLLCTAFILLPPVLAAVRTQKKINSYSSAVLL